MSSNNSEIQHVNLQYDSQETTTVYKFCWNVQLGNHWTPDLPPREIRSPIYSFGNDNEHAWQVTLNQNTRGQIVAILCNRKTPCSRKPRSEYSNTSVAAEIGFGESDAKGSTPPLGITWLEYKKIYHEIATLNGYNVLVNGTISIFGRIFVKSIKNDPFNDSKDEKKSKESRLLGCDLKNIWSSMNFSDATIKTPTREFPVHKVILSARSPVFAAMFSANTLEGKEGIVYIVDGCDESVAAMLEYMYTEKSEIMESSDDVDCLLDILAFSDKYDLPRLKEICEAKLSTVLTLDNVTEIFIVAGFHLANGLRNSAKMFARRNKPGLLRNVVFQSMVKMHGDLLVKLFV